VRIDNANSQSVPSQQDEGALARQQDDGGVWHGAAVQLAQDPRDIITDAAEEITFEHSEHVESHKLEEREIEEEPPLELPALESIITYLDTAGQGEDAEERLRAFVEALKRNANRDRDPNHSHGHIGPREESRRQFGCVTEQFLALAFAADALRREGGYETLLDEVHEALEELHEDFSSRIRTDLNTVNAAGAFAGGDAEKLDAFQATYHDAVINGQSLGAMLKGALDRFGEDDYRSSVQHLIRALGDDLAAMRGPSAEPARLGAVLQDLYQMEILATMLEGCQTLAKRLSADHGVPAPRAGVLLQDLIAASGERWSNAGRFNAIADKHGAAQPTPRVAFLTSVKTLIRAVPVKVFADTDARSNVIDAAQAALDAAIEKEEEES
jgi:type III secretion protein W